MAETLTAKQRHWYEHIQRCDQSGLSMARYAAEHELDLKAFYNWKSILTKRGVLTAQAVSTHFTEVRVGSPTVCRAVGWRLRFPNGCVLEGESLDGSLMNAVLSNVLGRP